MKRIFTLLMALLMLLSVVALVACNNEPDDPKNNDNPPVNTPDPGDDTDEEDSRYTVADSLPAKGEVDYDSNFTILYHRENILPTFWVEDQTGGAVDNAVFAALANTEERFGVRIYALSGGQGGDNEHAAYIRTQISAGAPDFDISRIHDVNGGTLSLEGLFLNLYEIEAFDFTKPWWSEKSIDALSYMDQLYLISNSMSYNSLAGASCVYFNKDLLDDRELEYPYQLVLDNEWTMDEMLYQIEWVYTDSDSSDDKSIGDLFGLLIDDTLYFTIEKFGIEMVYKDENGDLVLDDGTNENMLELLDVLYRVSYESDGGYLGARADVNEMFGEGQGLYYFGTLNNAVSTFAAYDVDYGIVPMPMLNEDQDGYIAAYSDFFFVIPYTCLDIDYVGTIVESMSAEGYRTVTPVYFEKILKDRYSKDAESKAMVDLIQDTMYFGFDYIYGGNKWFSMVPKYLLVNEHSKDFASWYAQNISAANERLEMVVDKFTEMKELAD